MHLCQAQYKKGAEKNQMERDLFKDKRDKFVVGFLNKTIEYGERWAFVHAVALHAHTMYVFVK